MNSILQAIRPLAVLLVLASLASAQQPAFVPTQQPAQAPQSTSQHKLNQPNPGPVALYSPARKSEMEMVLDEALKNNPDLKVVQAKVAQAEAELLQARLQVARKVVAAYQEVETARATVALLSAQLVRQKELWKSRAISEDAVTSLEKALGEAKAKLATAEAEFGYVAGKSGTVLKWTGSTAGARYGEGALAVVGQPIPDPLRKALDKRITVDATAMKSAAFLEVLKKEAPEIHIQANVKGEVWSTTVTAKLKDVTWGTALQLLEDVVDERVVVRSYGLLIVPREKVPPGAVLLSDYRRARPTSNTLSGTLSLPSPLAK